MDRHLAFVLCVMAIAMEKDNHRPKNFAPWAIGEASRVELPDDDTDVETYAVHFTDYVYGIVKRPEWMK